MLYNRRKFIRNSAAVLAGAVMLPESVSATRSGSNISILSNNFTDESYWEFLKSQFSLLEGMRYFNNGSLGPSPEYVIDRTEKYRRTLDGYPSKYMWGGWNGEKEDVRKLIATLLGADKEEIAIIHNTSEGMNIFARSFNLREGDEVILADHEHRTGVAPFEYFCQGRGVKLIRPVLPVLPESGEELFDVYRRAITPRTKLISMVHMTNTNGMILPVKEVSALAHSKGIMVCVDAAQSVGHIKTDVKELGCDFIAASGHKWLWGPKGTGILYAARDKQHLLSPLMVSQNWSDTSIRMFEDYNTRNLPELLGLGTAIDFNNIIGTGKKEQRIYELKRYFRSMIEGQKKFILKTPAPDDLSAGIQVVEIEGIDVVKAASQL
ncbi:MAG: aminotransferase class V-fold PLP-dependent enzyme, partial [Marinilabiliaceae bacterium]|nr:aminotransferase class V-fold PLP-dependent enzyme [Marinilabiliaceae bacterium]